MQWLEDDFEDSCDFSLIGVSSHLPPHRICWQLNQALHWHLEFNHILKITQRTGDSSHVVYRYAAPTSEGEVLYFMVENKIQGGAVAKYKGAEVMDYLIQVYDDSEAIKELISKVRSVPGVNYVQELDPVNSGAMEHLALIDLAESEAN